MVDGKKVESYSSHTKRMASTRDVYTRIRLALSERINVLKLFWSK